MNKFIITCCSTVDLTNAQLKKNNNNYIRFKYLLDGKEYLDDMEESISSSEFFKKMNEGAMPTTSQINSEQYIYFFEPFLNAGIDVLHLCLSSGLSGSYNSALLAKQYLDEKYPNSKLIIIDSLGGSSGSGLLLDYLNDLKEEGKSIEECANWAIENRLHVHHWFISTDLTAYKRGGRITSTSFFLGQLLKICPLMNVDLHGKLIPRKKIRTKDKAISELVETMINHANDGLNYNGKCYISHSDCIEDAEKLKKIIEDKFVNLKNKVEIYNIGTVIGSHSGPGTIALFYLGDERID